MLVDKKVVVREDNCINIKSEFVHIMRLTEGNYETNSFSCHIITPRIHQIIGEEECGLFHSRLTASNVSPSLVFIYVSMVPTYIQLAKFAEASYNSDDGDFK